MKTTAFAAVTEREKEREGEKRGDISKTAMYYAISFCNFDGQKNAMTIKK